MHLPNHPPNHEYIDHTYQIHTMIFTLYVFLAFAHSRRDNRIWQGAISSCIFAVSCERRAYVLLLQVQQGGRCYRTVRHLYEDGTADSCW